MMMILNGENIKINLWAYKPEYVKKTRFGNAPVQLYVIRGSGSAPVQILRSGTIFHPFFGHDIERRKQ